MGMKSYHVVLLAGLITAFLSCKKNNDAPVVSTSIDSLNVVNATANTINLYLNGTRLNNNSNLYPSGLPRELATFIEGVEWWMLMLILYDLYYIVMF